MMRRQRGNPARGVFERTSVGRKYQRRLVRGHPREPIEVLMQGVGRALRVKADVRGKVREHVVAREEQLFVAFIKTDVPGRVSWRPLHAQLPAPHVEQLSSVELYSRIGRLDHLAQGALRVAENFGFARGHAVDEEVGVDLADPVLELDVSGVDERDLEAVQVEVCASIAGQRAGCAVVVGVDMSDDEAPDSLRAEFLYGSKDGVHGLFGVHPAVEQVNVVAVREQEDVDEAVLERDGPAELEHPLRNFAPRPLNPVPGIVYDGWYRPRRVLRRSACLKSRCHLTRLLKPCPSTSSRRRRAAPKPPSCSSSAARTPASGGSRSTMAPRNPARATLRMHRT